MTASLKKLLDSAAFPQGEAWQRRCYKANEEILRDGDLSDELYLVLSGVARVLGNIETENKRNIRPGLVDLHTNEVFGELCLYDSQPRSCSVVSLSDCEIAVINTRILRDHLGTHPEVGYPILIELIGTLGNRLRKANQRVESLLAWGLRAYGIEEHL